MLQCSRGLQAFRVFSIDDSAALLPLTIPPDTHVFAPRTCELGQVEAKWFRRPRRVGCFVSGGKAPDVFVHIETLHRFGLTELLPSRFKRLTAPEVAPRILRSNQRFPELSRAGAHRSQASPAVSNMTASSAACAPSPDQATNWNAE